MLLSGNTSFCLTIECPRSVHAIVLALSLEVSDFHILIEKRITFMDRVKRVIHCDRAYKMGLNGKNITVAVMDTAGSIGGSGLRSKDKRGVRLLSGVAPRVRFVVLKVLDRKGNGVTSHVLEGMDWLLQNREKYQVKILNISVGMMASAGKNEQEQLLHAVDEAWNQGIMVVTAAGNNGPKENSVTIPGISRKVLTVGSWDDNVTETGNSGRLTKNYSGFGPTECCIVKPEVLAPGTNVKSCSKDAKGYIVKSGTSMAAPVVSGAIALAYQKYPDYTPTEMKLKLYESVYPRGEQIGRKCWGMLHVNNLVV